jgi:hypothetical protein
MRALDPRLRHALVWVVFGVLLVSFVPASSGSSEAPGTYFVSPQGNDENEGQSAESPFSTIQAALARAEAGDTIRIQPGEYLQDFSTVRSGAPGAPIRLIAERGEDGRVAIIRGAGNSHIVDIQHSHIWLEDLIINGLVGPAAEVDGYRSKLVYVLGGGGESKGVSGVRLLRLTLRNAGTECVRFKFSVSKSEVAESLLENCGVWDFRFDRGMKNGEAIYIGTAPEQLPEDYPDPHDLSSENWIHGNWFRTNGAECVDVKEGSSRNLVEKNDCSGQLDPDSGGISIRGHHNIVRDNIVHHNVGAGIRLGGDEPTDGIHNEVVGNRIHDNRFAALKIMSHPQAKICGNRIWNQASIVRGNRVENVDPDEKC